jgi:DNA repair exonuclease SbcCD nuclease subunit
MGVRFLHAADIHLDSPLCGLDAESGAPAARIQAATRLALGRLVDLALERDVALLLIAGDLLDGDHPDARSGLYFAQQMARLTRDGRQVILIRGNHDAEAHLSQAFRLPAGVRLLDHRRPETVLLPELGLAVHGQSFASRAVAENLARNYPRAIPGLLNIGLLHTALDQSGGPHERYAPCSRADLVAAGYDYWALGHIHAREEVSRAPWIVYSGNLQARHVNETGPKGATLVSVENGRIAAVEACAVDVFRFARVVVDVSTAADPDQVWTRVQEALQRAVAAADGRGLAVRVTLEGESACSAQLAAIDLRLAVLSEAATLASPPWIEKVESALVPPAAPLLERADALGALARRIGELAAAPPADLLGDWPAHLRERLPPGALAADHLLFDPARLLARARDLLLSRLGSG